MVKNGRKVQEERHWAGYKLIDELVAHRRVKAHRRAISLTEIETGRWSRIPRERRLCNCGLAEVQDEKHVIETCHHLSELRLTFPKLDFRLEAFFNNDLEELASYSFKALNILA